MIANDLQFLSDTTFDTIRNKKICIDKLLSQRNDLEASIADVEKFLNILKEKRTELDDAITSAQCVYEELSIDIQQKTKSITSPKEIHFTDDFATIEKKVLKSFGFSGKDKNTTKIRLPPKPIVGDTRKTLVLMDLPNIINSYIKFDKMKDESKPNRYFDANIVKEMLQRYAIDVYADTIDEIRIYTNANYAHINQFLDQWKKLSKIPVSIQMKGNATSYDTDTVDNSIMKQLYVSSETIHNRNYARILLFSGDHLYLEPFKLFMEKGIKCHVFGFYGSLSNRYVQYAKQACMKDGTLFSSNGEQCMAYYYMQADEFDEEE